MGSDRGAEGFAAAYWGWMGDNHPAALHTAAITLTQEMLDIVCSLESNADDDQFEPGGTFIVDYLPSTYATRHDNVFAKRFLACVMAVTWKLGQRTEFSLSCLAEELALNAMIKLAEKDLEQQGEEHDFDGLRSAVEDEDFLFLFDPANDGVADLAGLGMAHMRFDEWFDQFRSATERVHPFAVVP
jgi:hypothetical protein